MDAYISGMTGIAILRETNNGQESFFLMHTTSSKKPLEEVSAPIAARYIRMSNAQDWHPMDNTSQAEAQRELDVAHAHTHVVLMFNYLLDQSLGDDKRIADTVKIVSAYLSDPDVLAMTEKATYSRPASPDTDFDTGIRRGSAAGAEGAHLAKFLTELKEAQAGILGVRSTWEETAATLKIEPDQKRFAESCFVRDAVYVNLAREWTRAVADGTPAATVKAECAQNLAQQVARTAAEFKA